MAHNKAEGDAQVLPDLKHDTIYLNAEAWAQFAELLLAPPQPNERLKEALSEHARVVRGGT